MDWNCWDYGRDNGEMSFELFVGFAEVAESWFGAEKQWSTTLFSDSRNDAQRAMVCTANDLHGWKDFPKGLRVLLLDGDTSSAAEIKTKLEEMEYVGKKTLPLIFVLLIKIFPIWKCYCQTTLPLELLDLVFFCLQSWPTFPLKLFSFFFSVSLLSLLCLVNLVVLVLDGREHFKDQSYFKKSNSANQVIHAKTIALNSKLDFVRHETVTLGNIMKKISYSNCSAIFHSASEIFSSIYVCACIWNLWHIHYSCDVLQWEWCIVSHFKQTWNFSCRHCGGNGWQLIKISKV